MPELLPPASLRAELRRQCQAIWQLTVQQSATFDHILNKMEHLTHQLKYDSIHGRDDDTIKADGDSFIIDGQKVTYTRDPSESPFTEHGAAYVCESTGVSLTAEKFAPRFKAGAKKVGKTSNDKVGVQRDLRTMEHAMTASQPTVDGSSKKDWRGLGKLTDMAICVPTIDSYVAVPACELEEEASYEEKCAEANASAEGDTKGSVGNYEVTEVEMVDSHIVQLEAFLKMTEQWDNSMGNALSQAYQRYSESLQGFLNEFTQLGDEHPQAAVLKHKITTFFEMIKALKDKCVEHSARGAGQ